MLSCKYTSKIRFQIEKNVFATVINITTLKIHTQLCITISSKLSPIPYRNNVRMQKVENENS